MEEPGSGRGYWPRPPEPVGRRTEASTGVLREEAEEVPRIVENPSPGRGGLPQGPRARRTTCRSLPWPATHKEC